MMTDRYEVASSEILVSDSEENVEVDRRHRGNTKTKAVAVIAVLVVLAVAFARTPFEGRDASAGSLRVSLADRVTLVSNSTEDATLEDTIEVTDDTDDIDGVNGTNSTEEGSGHGVAVGMQVFLGIALHILATLG